MILFKKEHIVPILLEQKTITRRTGDKPRWKVGALHQAKTGYGKKDVFAIIKIEAVREITYADIPSEEVEEYRNRYFKKVKSDTKMWEIKFSVYYGLKEVMKSYMEKATNPANKVNSKRG